MVTPSRGSHEGMNENENWGDEKPHKVIHFTWKERDT